MKHNKHTLKDIRFQWNFHIMTYKSFLSFKNKSLYSDSTSWIVKYNDIVDAVRFFKLIDALIFIFFNVNMVIRRTKKNHMYKNILNELR